MHRNILHTHRHNKSHKCQPFLSAFQKWNRRRRAERKEKDFQTTALSVAHTNLFAFHSATFACVWAGKTLVT